MSEPREPLRDAVVTWALVAAAVTVLVRLPWTVPWIGHVGSAVVAVIFLYAPVVVGWRRGEVLEDYGFHAAPVGRGLATAGAAIFAIFPIFAFGYFAFYEIACHSSLLAHLVPRHMCARYDGISALHAPALSWDFAEFCLVQWVVVALPEELFFRGFLLKLLEQRFPPRRRVLGGGVGIALVISAAMFALVHLPKDGDPRALATFFPGLLFGWMRSSTNSILASTVTHGASNILIRLLDLCTLR